jgi:hypothetical protein
MNTLEANIEITRQDGHLSSVSVVMPSWNKIGDDNVIVVDLPLFGLKTFAASDNDIDVAIEEAIKGFCLIAEKFGKGLDAELLALGWTAIQNENEHISLDFNIPDDNSVFEQIMQTGDQYAHADLEFA